MGAIPAKADHALAREDIAQGEEPRVFDVAQHDSRMRAAVHEAQRTVGVFILALRHPAAGESDFEVKKPFRQGDVVEHIWLADVTFSGNRFTGYIDNKPRKIKGLKLGDRVSVNANEISDWAFLDNGRLIGGYTIRVLYMELSAADKAALAKEARFRIGAANQGK
jgi:uncharacterized protein YegJ (DUF2314 family)